MDGSGRVDGWKRGAGVLLGLVLAVSGSETVNPGPPPPGAGGRAEGIGWPAGQALPAFASPAETLDALDVRSMSPDEAIAFSSLQGRVNRRQPRILLLDSRAGEGRDTWVRTLGLKAIPTFGRGDKYRILAKYAGEVAGAVLYDPAKSPHYRNLAGTVAGLRGALPMTPEVHARAREQGIELKVVEDLTALPMTSPVGIYGHLHEHYWPDCEKRVLLSARPYDRGGDHHHTRDLAAAVGAAVVWLDAREPEQRELMRRFLGDMKAGEAVVLGWHATERSGVTTASEFGIGTIPSDHFNSATVYAGTGGRIEVPTVPRMPALENKAYVAIFISDGDNIQYVQHAMRQMWDRSAQVRGRVALNWTIAPGLVDIGPGLLNYYYGSATPMDCFVTGPSGMGYLMPFNTLREEGAPVGIHTRDESRMAGYARLTETYLRRSGLRVATIWDDATPMQRAQYERFCRTLYGATVQNFRDVPSVKASVEGGRLRFEKLVIPYAGSREHLGGSLRRELRRWDGRSPLFLAYQVEAWGEMKPDRIVALHDELRREFGERVEFVRADHYFNLRNRAEGLPFNLSMAPGTQVRGVDGGRNAAAAIDGSPSTHWTATGDGAWLGLDFGEAFTLSRCVIQDAGEPGADPRVKPRGFTVAVSSDGQRWQEVVARREVAAEVTDVDLPPVRARYLKLEMEDAGSDAVARIAELEVFGRR